MVSFAPEIFLSNLPELQDLFQSLGWSKRLLVQTAKPFCTHSNDTVYKKKFFFLKIKTASPTQTEETQMNGREVTLTNVFDRHRK